MTLARAIEVRMEEVLARHVRCREVKTVLDRALHMASRQQRQAQRTRLDEKRTSQTAGGGGEPATLAAGGKDDASEHGTAKANTPRPEEGVPKEDQTSSCRKGFSGKTDGEPSSRPPEPGHESAAQESSTVAPQAEGETSNHVVEGGGSQQVRAGVQENSAGGVEWQDGDTEHNNTERADENVGENQSSEERSASEEN